VRPVQHDSESHSRGRVPIRWKPEPVVLDRERNVAIDLGEVARGILGLSMFGGVTRSFLGNAK